MNVRKIFDEIIKESSMEDIIYFHETCETFLGCDHVTPEAVPIVDLFCHEDSGFLETEPAEPKIVETEFITANMKWVSELEALLKQPELMKSIDKIGNSLFTTSFLYNCVTIMFEQGFTVHKISGVKFEEPGSYFVNFQGFCAIHGKCHSSNHFSWIWNRINPLNSIIRCFHDGKIKKLDFPMNI